MILQFEDAEQLASYRKLLSTMLSYEDVTADMLERHLDFHRQQRQADLTRIADVFRNLQFVPDPIYKAMTTTDNKMFNTLDEAKKHLIESLAQEGEGPRVFKDEDQLLKALYMYMMLAFKQGAHSYDPSIGELVFSINRRMNFDPQARMPDGRLVANVIREALTNDGWDDVTILPPVSGINRTLIKLRSKSLTSQVLSKSK